MAETVESSTMRSGVSIAGATQRAQLNEWTATRQHPSTRLKITPGKLPKPQEVAVRQASRE